MGKFFAAAAIAVVLAAPAAEAGGAFGSNKDHYDKHCDAQTGKQPGYGSPRCRMEAPLAPGEKQIVKFFGFTFIHVGTGK